MLHAYYVLRKRLQRIQRKNQDFLTLLTHKFPFINPTSSQHALIMRSPHRPVNRTIDPDNNSTKEPSPPPLPAGLPSFNQHSPRTLALLSPRAAARLAQSTSAIATLSLLSTLHLLSTRCTRLTLHRHHTLLSQTDNKDLIYLVQTGQLSILRPSSVRTEEQEERNEQGQSIEWTQLVRGDDIGLYEVVKEMRDEHRRREARERAEKARMKREEQEWERIKQAGLITKEMNFLRAKKTRDEQRRQSVLLSQQLHDEADEAEERKREADRQQQRWPFTVVARQTSVVYVVSRAAVRECMREQPMLCVRMCEWMEETEAYRNARWQHVEQQRAHDEANRRADGHLTAFQPSHQLPHAHLQLPSWQTAYQRTREQEREARDKWRREEEKKRTMDDTMHALHSSSVAMLTAVAAEEAGGMGRAGLKSREEMDVVLLRARLDAELVKDAMKKRALLAMFKSEAQEGSARSSKQEGQAQDNEEQKEAATRENGQEEPQTDEQHTRAQSEELEAVSDREQNEQQQTEEVIKHDEDEQSLHGQQSSQLTIELSQPRASLTLPPLRLDLLPPPSPVSDASTASAIDLSASASPFVQSPAALTVGSGFSSPMFSSAASSMDTSTACSPSSALFILPKSPPPADGEVRTAFTFTQYEPLVEQKEVLIETAVSLPSFDRLALLPSVATVSPAAVMGGVRGAWHAKRELSDEVSDEQVRFLMLQLLYQPRPPPLPQLAARRQQPMVLIPQPTQQRRLVHHTTALSAVTPAEQRRYSRRVQSKQHRVERLAQHIAAYWQSDDARLREQQRAEQEALRQQLVSELRRRREAARVDEERRQKREAAEAERARQREEEERQRRAEQERESFNFTNLRAKTAAGSGTWSFLTQHGVYVEEAEEKQEEEGDEQGEGVVRMYDSDGSGPSSVRSTASRKHSRRPGSSLQLPPVIPR